MEHKSEKVNQLNPQLLASLRSQAKQLPLFVKIAKQLYGNRLLFNTYTVSKLAQNKELYPEYKDNIDKCQKQYRKTTYICIALSAALALSARRYLPTIYSSFSLNMVAADMFIVTLGLVLGKTYGGNNIQTRLHQITSGLIQKPDKNFMRHLRQFQTKYAITNRNLAYLVSKNQGDVTRAEELLNKSTYK